MTKKKTDSGSVKSEPTKPAKKLVPIYRGNSGVIIGFKEE
jgi:hypothetical protein